MNNRDRALRKLKEIEEVPVLIVGAGINGIGTFRDLALQGIDVAMVDRADFCSGASMASSHMLHGGLRYLENGEFGLVREALHERNRLLRNAPHLTQPLATAIPIYKRFSGMLNAPLKFAGLLERPGERGALVIKLGLMLYDLLAGTDGPLPGHQWFNRQQSLARWPDLNPEVLNTARYWDGYMPSPERICMELIADAERDHADAMAINYLKLAGIESGQVVLELESGEQIRLKPEVVVNAAGPWIDFANERLEEKTSFIGGTKGSHIILDHPPLRAALDEHEFFFEYFDGRIVLILPHLDRVIVGTTDLRIQNPDEAACTPDEIEYMLGMIPKVFPGIHVGLEHVIFQYSGVRPLPPAQGRTGQISRDHSIEILEADSSRPFPIINLIGGKWTSYRAFSEQAADVVLNRLQLHRRASTRDLAIGGGAGFPLSEAKQQEWIDERRLHGEVNHAYLEQLLWRYGTRADRILAAVEAGGPGLLPTSPSYALEELRLLIQTERVHHLDDLLLRRTMLAWLGQLDRELLDQISQVAAQELGWTESQRRAEVSQSITLLMEEHGVDFKRVGRE
jgi:glycerol-3-phosphate dehydrogenase